jgi:hypothetical protein
VQGRGQYTGGCCSGTGFICPNPPCGGPGSGSSSPANKPAKEKKSKKSRGGDDSGAEDGGRKSKKKKDKHKKKEKDRHGGDDSANEHHVAQMHMPLEPQPLKLPNLHSLIHGDDDHGPRGLIRSLFGGPPHGNLVVCTLVPMHLCMFVCGHTCMCVYGCVCIYVCCF